MKWTIPNDPNLSPRTRRALQRAIRAAVMESSGAINVGTVASEATLLLTNATSEFVVVTGTTTVTGINEEAAGVVRRVIFDDSLILTHNATSFILPGDASIMTVEGDAAEFYSTGGGNWICYRYSRGGTPPSSRYAMYVDWIVNNDIGTNGVDYNYDNGVDGVGATITFTALAAQTIGTIPFTPALGDLILVQHNQFGGIFEKTTAYSGTGPVYEVWTRHDSMDTIEKYVGSVVFCIVGGEYGGVDVPARTQWAFPATTGDIPSLVIGTLLTYFVRIETLWTKELLSGRIIIGQASGYADQKVVSGDAALANDGALTIANDAVTFAKMQDISTDRLIGRDTASSGDPEEIAVAEGVEFTGSTSIRVDSDYINGFSIINGYISTSVASNALSIAIKNAAGNDPSSGDPVKIAFRDATAATGTYTILTLTAATSLTLSNGSTLGTTASTAYRLWIVGFNDGGTFRLGAVNCLSGKNILALRDDLIKSSTAEGGAGGADSAHVIYTGTAVTSKPMKLLGYIEYSSGLSTAGQYASDPTKIQLFGPGVPKPGEVIQDILLENSTAATGTTTIPADNTIPQNTEGTEFFSQAITPTATCNLLEIDVKAYATASALVACIAALFQDSTANALQTDGMNIASIGGFFKNHLYHKMLAATTSSTTFKVRIGGSGASTITFNGSAGNNFFNGTYTSHIRIKEIMR